MFGEHPVELGLRRDGSFLTAAQGPMRSTGVLFARAFPEAAEPFTIEAVARAIACFERSIISGRSAYDRYHYDGDDSAISDSAKRGEVIFFSQPYTCFQCHGGFNFSSAELHDNFKAPTLRNIELTPPYMHDGSQVSLEAVIEHHAESAASLSGTSRRDLVAFLDSLTDRAVTKDPRFSNPW